MKTTVITPFFRGNEYMTDYVRMIEENASSLDRDAGEDLDVIIVNDSPGYEVDLSSYRDKSVSIRVINNEKNLGIHGSRVRGLTAADGDYVIFLDQDDILKSDAVHLFEKVAKEKRNTVIVSNAILEQDGWKGMWCRTAYQASLVGDLDTYLLVGTQIVSPGQCLIPRDMIPEAWKKNFLKRNGADDYFLWILMLESGVSFTYLDEPLYTHRFTDKNISADTEKTDASVYEFAEILAADEKTSFDRKKIKKDMKTLRNMISMKASWRKSGPGGKILTGFRHPMILLSNINYKIRTKTPPGFNRQ
jgi:glycosyltransferase involved in cell wall biosynthesis